MTTKMTNRKALAYVLENCDIPEDVRQKLEGMVAALVKKAAHTSRKPTAKEQATAALRTTLYDFLLNSGAKLTCTEIAGAVPELNGSSSQRMSALLRPMVEDGSVLVDKVKGKSVFYAAPLDLEPVEDEGEEG